MTVTLGHFLAVGAILFAISVVGIFLNRKNLIVLLMAIELMLLAVNMNFVAFSHFLGDMHGQVFVFFILTVAAAESAIGLEFLVLLFRNKSSISVEELNTLKAQKARDTRMLLYIACISLLVGGIGIMNIMLATVTERTQEIGIRRALGATQTDITVQFMVEALMLCLMGGSIGVVGGWGFAVFRHNILHITTIVTEWSVVVAFGLSVVVGLFFGIWPAIKAASLDPIEALRHT